MRLILPIAALALVTACKKEQPTQPAAPVEQEAAVATPAALPTVAANARTTLKYAGSYSQVDANGKATTLKLNADDTYEWSDADGKVTRGKFAWYKDGSRILLDAAGGKAVYAIADGAVFKLPNKDAPVGSLTADQMWKRGAM
jgi:hypothetical protein